MDNQIRFEQLYQHPIDKVWRAISNRDAISTWFIQADFEAEVGYRYTFNHEGWIVKGEVLEVEPPSTLVYTWQVGDQQATTTVTWLLEAQDEGTLLVLEHTGFENYKESALEMFKSTSNGWTQVIAELQQYLDEDSHDR